MEALVNGLIFFIMMLLWPQFETIERVDRQARNIAGRPQGRYYRPLVDNRPFCLNGRYSWICGRYCIKMVDISSKSLRMVIDFPYYLKYDKSQDLKVYYSAIKWSNMKISTSTLFYMYLLGSRIQSCPNKHAYFCRKTCKYALFKELLWSIFGR